MREAGVAGVAADGGATGVLMSLIGKDALRLRFDASVPSYWIARPLASEEKPSMKLQL